MKIILNILIVLVKLCASDSSVYDWHVRTIERGSDFGDDLKVQTALNNERQQDLLKISGKANAIDYNNPNSYYPQFNNIFDKGGKKADDKNKFGEKMNMKYQENSNMKSSDDQTKNSGNKIEANSNRKYNYKNDDGDQSHYDYEEDHYYSKFKDNHQQNPQINRKDNHQYHSEGLGNMLPHTNRKYFDYHDEDNNSYHDLKHIELNTYKSDHIDQNQPHNEPLDTKLKNVGKGNDNNEYRDEQISNNINSKQNSQSNVPLITHCSGKYLDIESFVGTNLFDSPAKRCFSSEEVALLAARKDFESLLPKDLPQCLLNDQMVALLMNYFYICHQMILRMTSQSSKHLAQKAFYDTLGGYLNFYLVPVTKYSYYAGQISLTTAQQILTLHQESKKLLNTNGNGWKAPLQNVLIELKSIHIEPLHMPADASEQTCDEPSFCMHLDMATDEYQSDDDKMIVQLPRLEAEDANGYLANIWLPFRRKRSFDLKSESSAYVVVKFYETVTKCYRFENIDQQHYDSQFKTWLLENINVHLSDEQFYPGLGAVLRIYEYLKRRKKNNNLFAADEVEMESADDSFIKYHSPQVRSGKKVHNIRKTEHRMSDRNNQSEETNASPRERNKTKQNNAKRLDHNNMDIIKSIIDPSANAISPEEDIKLDAGAHTDSMNSKFRLRTIADLTPPQMAVIAIPVIAIILVVIICCCKMFCKKKKPEIQLIPKKNSSSSSSNLFNSPVRFFNVRKKSVSDYSSNEAGNKKGKKSVKIEKKPLLNSDTSASSSPVRNKKSMDKGKTKDSCKSNV